MPSVPLDQFLSLTHGRLIGELDTSRSITGGSIDSRTVQPGELFFALPGRRQHGLAFADVAMSHGALAVVVDAQHAAATDAPQIVVDDAEYALAQLASCYRHQLDTLVIGITGSVGKTTTRRLIHSVLSASSQGTQSPANYNNALGVPLSLLAINQADEFAAIEVATSQPGEIGYLASIARPEMAVLTRIAPAHLEGLGSLEAIRAEKAELLQAVPRDGVAFLNMDDPLLRPLATALSCRVVTFGEHPDSDLRATDVTADGERLSLTVNGVRFQVKLFGAHHVTNVMAAIAVATEVGLGGEDIQRGLEQFHPEPGRSAVQSVGPWTIIDDTYNASPTSVTALAGSLSSLHGGQRLLVLGDMLDLGDQAADLHYAVGATLAQTAIDHILTTGVFCESVVEGFLASGGHISRISQFTDLNTLQSMLDIILRDADVVAVKGSRATRMERVVEFLQQRAASATDSVTDESGIRRAA